MKIEDLNQMVMSDAALRRRQTLQPVGGKGDKIFPPTYPGQDKGDVPRHVYEWRGTVDKKVWCVLVDSVQSQANRLEEALRGAMSDGTVIPHLVVDFSGTGLTGLDRITSLDAPHRVYDAIFRDSLLAGKPFMASDEGQRLAKARPDDAASLLEMSPTALLFGAWHSTGEGGGLGAKFARCLTSEIVAIDVPVDERVVNERTAELEPRTSARRTGSRIDPLGILRKVEIFKGEAGWDTSEKAAGKKAKKVRPSEINHGNIAPSVEPLGITCERLEHTFVLSFAALRRLRFGSDDRNVAARSMLAALGILALAEQDARGYALRSRCDLVCDGRDPIEVVHMDGSSVAVELSTRSARELYESARKEAIKAGFAFPAEPVTLIPQDKLVEIIRSSQELALAGAGGEEGAGEES